MGPIVQVEDLRKSFGASEVLHGVSFSIEKGEVLSVIGPSGGGKSTLLRCVTNLERVTSGSIRVADDYLVRDGVYAPAHVQRAICLRVGLVFQDFNLFPHFTVLRNVTEAQVHVLRRPGRDAARRARDLLGKMGLSDKEASYPCELSGGQQQRVSIARALALEPEVLFFDEPTSALDPELTGEILKVIRRLAAEHMTMVIVTHEMAFARDVSDRAIFLDGGLVAEEGPSRDVFERPRNARTRAFLSHYAGNGRPGDGQDKHQGRQPR